ncbi:ParB N-terminal domain-containing protein [Planctomicrobium piriforme]|uniref:Chromosome segregation protein Spo0J, contains ParB-like nuclease domain n=1 Tax=Planctomicrobium piriforme TaxID=1576369 RepID=A0A1I3DFB1_9PLAN|nr:ParB N-terminal domain-containing protein [Planctomicrobium piriforme]SFH85326.1 Chromosome segregation protein Spo0J, contains ParB-like nuclease domain [Planctomicrobium piriforme]
MLLKTLPVTSLNPAPYNPRISLKPGDAAWKKLERSLAEFQLVQPIVWNERTGHVVSGHQRLAILKHHGETEVDCVVVDLPLEREQALNITLNNSEVGSDWDPDRLIDLVAELQELPEFDATLTGFDAQQLHDLLLAPVDQNEEEDAANADETNGLLQVTLEVPPDVWPEVQQELDSLLTRYPDLRLHIRNQAAS